MSSNSPNESPTRTAPDQSPTGTADAGPTLSLGRQSLRSAAALKRASFKGDIANPPYAIDAEAEGTRTAVDRSDNDLAPIDLGRKYQGKFSDLELVIINISGTMVEDLNDPLKPYPGDLIAYDLLKEQIPVALMTNSWKMSKKAIGELLKTKDFNVDSNDIFTSSDACKEYMKEKNLDRPYYLVSPDVLNDFTDEYPRRHNENVVIVGLPSTEFAYRLLSKGMKLLTDGNPPAPLISLNMMKGPETPNVQNKTLGPGPFVSMLSACTDAEPVVVGKPSQFFYEALCKKFGCSDFSKAVVIGDVRNKICQNMTYDCIHEDIAGAKSLGFKAILTRSGRYLVNDEKVSCPGLAPDATAETFAMAARLVLSCSAISNMTDDDFVEEEHSSKGCGSMFATNEDMLARKMEGYVRYDFTSKHSQPDPNNNPLRLPSYIW